MKARLRPGGLMRCCLATLEEHMELRERPIKEGEVLPCKHCTNSMRYRDHAWEWNQPADLNPR